ncbi:MAG: hypothetical protein PUP46_08810, partial [Endozoicomonas sp. (ex Botrylloides leachii)]|nr:hypothetical protein [Endozoicomonas sp. (ex Botrylloides leachii)]
HAIIDYSALFWGSVAMLIMVVRKHDWYNSPTSLEKGSVIYLWKKSIDKGAYRIRFVFIDAIMTF